MCLKGATYVCQSCWMQDIHEATEEAGEAAAAVEGVFQVGESCA